jgi:PAS domain S-box-containing protein
MTDNGVHSDKTALIQNTTDNVPSDITEGKKAKEAVKASLDRWQTTFDAIPDIVCVISNEHTFLEINMAGALALHLPREEILGKKCYELVHGTEAALPVCPCTLTLETGMEGFSEYNQNGRIYSLITWPQKDESGMVLSFVHIIKDITDHKKAEEALKESEQNYRTLADSGRALVWTAGTDKLCNYFNSVWLGFTGRTLEQELGNGWAEGVHHDDLQRCLGIYAGAFDRRSSFSMEYRLRHYDGEYRWILDDGCPRYDANGTFTGYIGHCLDITDRKRDEDEIRTLNTNLEQRVQERTAELLAANKELEAFSYSVSHDLRAPLHSIEGFSQLFLDEYGAGIPEKAHEYLEHVRHNSLRMGKLIDAMLELSRLTLSEMHVTKTDLSALAAELAGELAADNPQRKVQMSIEPGMTAVGDPNLLRVVLTNLLGNAWKFTSKREHAHVSIGTVIDPDYGSAFFVRDDGIGFNNAYKDKLFGVFQRLHSDKEFPGTGVGLATVARIIRRHRGEVWAEGKVGKGATFYFTLQPIDNEE